eukprot:403338963
MKRYTSVVVAFFLGVISAAELTNEHIFLQTTGDVNKAMQAKEFVTNKYEDLTRLNCLLYDDLTFFDIRTLESGNTYNIGKYHFNFCRRLEDSSSDEKTFAYADISSLFDSSVRLTGDGKPSRVDAMFDAQNPNGTRHLYFEIDGGEKCDLNTDKNVEKFWKVRYEINCDATVTGTPVLTLANLDLTSDVCAPKLTFSHKAGCPAFQATSIVRFLSDNPWALGVILLIFGSIVTFFGGKFFHFILPTIAGGVLFLGLLLFGSVMGTLVALDKGKQSSAGEITLCVMTFIVSACIAGFVAWFIKRIQRTGICLVGSVAGFFLGFILYTFVFAQWLQHVALLITLCSVGALTLGYLAYKFDRHLIIYLTGFIGAYSLIRGVSMFAGHFPNEVLLYQQLSNNVFEGLGWEFYVYMASMVVLAVLGIKFQFKRGYQLHEDDYDGDYQKV